MRPRGKAPHSDSTRGRWQNQDSGGPAFEAAQGQSSFARPDSRMSVPHGTSLVALGHKQAGDLIVGGIGVRLEIVGNENSPNRQEPGAVGGGEFLEEGALPWRPSDAAETVRNFGATIGENRLTVGAPMGEDIGFG